MAEPLTTYPFGEPFPGVIGRTIDQSTPAWPVHPSPPEGAPNVVLFVLDDVGYGQLSAFGGLCETPNIDRVADRGLRYSNFQTTALCSPTRVCLLSGRNHHTLGMSAITELSMGYPAHNAITGFEHGFLSEALVEHGYNTFAVGKWHVTPAAETTPAGPYTRWPLGRGFERFYGFMGGDTDQWHPDLVHDNHSVPQPATFEEGYHLNADLADHAIDFIKDAHVNAPDKPFFLYYCTGAGHAPHQVEPEWIEKYRGAFDDGWDEYRRTVFERQMAMGLLPANTVLSERDPDVEAWDSLSDDQRRMYTRQMETYAGFLSQTDHHFGRVIDFIDTLGELDNTIVIIVSDNGASAEGRAEGTRNEGLFFNFVPETLEDNLEVYDEWGGENTFNHYSWGWAWAGDTPFRRWKRETYRGGVTDPCIIAWPSRIAAAGGVRQQYLHAIDIAPTVLDAIGITPPSSIRGVPQSELHGVSVRHTFDDAEAPSLHSTQYSEMFGHRAIYHEGWKAVCPWPGPSLAEGAERGRPFGSAITADMLDRLDADDWELYHLDEDPAECVDLASAEPERVADMVRRWWAEAERYGVLPVASVDLGRFTTRRPTTTGGPRRKQVTFYPGGSPIPFAAAPNVNNRRHSITARVTLPADGAEGILLSHGNRHGGYALYLCDGHLHYVHNFLGLTNFKVSSADPVPASATELRFEFEPNGPMDGLNGRGTPARLRLYVDGRLAGANDAPYTVPGSFGIAGVSCGYDAYDAVVPADYRAPFAFTGTLHEVLLDLTGELTIDPESELTRLMAQQ